MTMEHVLGLYNYWIVIFLMMTGFYIVIASRNLFKTIIGLNIFQTSVFLLYITMGKIHEGTAPIIQNPVEHHDDSADEHALHGVETFSGYEGSDMSSSDVLDRLLDSVETVTSTNQVATVSFEEEVVGQVAEHGPEIIYSNPLPSVLMLTAIVVGIATTALALALVVRVREEYGTIEEDEILEMDRNS